MPQDAREERAKAIVGVPGAVKMVKQDLFEVKSQSGVGAYRVENHKGWTCNCPDHVTRGVECKHILAARLFVLAQKDLPQPIPAKRSYSQQWTAYNTAQAEEIILFDALLKELVSMVDEPGQEAGRPRLPIREQLFCAIQKVYSQLSSRRAQSLYRSATERGQIEHAPHFNVPSKLFNREDVTLILHRLIALSALPVADLEEDFAIDSTGFRTTSFSAYLGMKHGVKQEHRWVKAHLCVGVRTNIVTAAAITDSNGSDYPQFQPLIEKTAQGFLIHEVTADMAYSGRTNHDVVERLGGTAFILFKSNSSGAADGSAAWKKMYHYFQLHREEFMEHYHKRSNVETTNAAIKRKFGETLKSKNPVAQTNELLAKIVAYNLTVIIHEMYENGVKPDFLHLNGVTCTQSAGS